MKICSPILEDELKGLCTLTLSKEPVKISDNIIFLGEIPKINNFEDRKIIGQQRGQDGFVDDYIKDDTALVYKAKMGIYIITGCSHSGICNIIEYAKNVTGEEKVLGVIGGFHLFKVDEQVEETIKYFLKNNISELYPCHCTSFNVKAKIHEAIPIKEVGVGLEVEWI